MRVLQHCNRRYSVLYGSNLKGCKVIAGFSALLPCIVVVEHNTEETFSYFKQSSRIMDATIHVCLILMHTARMQSMYSRQRIYLFIHL